jgi:hypothetical protein
MKLLRGRELRLRMKQLDPVARRRVYRLTRRGEAASGPDEALMVAAVARRDRKWGPWMVAALLASIVF